jgi:hypothetical protein
MIASDLSHPQKEAVMGQAIPTQHPSVVLRSRYRQLRALLALAMIAVVGLTAAVVVLAIENDSGTPVDLATQVSTPSPASAARSDGGPEESTLAATVGTQPAATGPDESNTAAAIGSTDAPTTTGGPDESNTAAAIGSGDASTPTGGPDESNVARAISGD